MEVVTIVTNDSAFLAQLVESLLFFVISRFLFVILQSDTAEVLIINISA